MRKVFLWIKTLGVMALGNFQPRIVKMHSKLALILSLSSFLWAQAATPQSADGEFETALSAMIAFENKALENVIKNSPELLFEEDAIGRTLIDNAFFFVNDDLAPQTNFGFIEFLIANDFFDQPIDRSEHLTLAATSLRIVDRSIDLPEDIVVHKSRLPLIGLLSSVIEDRLKTSSVEDLESMEVIMAICDPDAIEGREENYVSRSASKALKNSLTSAGIEYLDFFVSGGRLDRKCVDALLG